MLPRNRHEASTLTRFLYQLYDMVGEFRSQMLHKTREIVKSHYSFSLEDSNLDSIIGGLKTDDNFCCEEDNPLVSQVPFKALYVVLT